MSRTVFSALSGMRLLACLIVAPQQGYDEPAIISYAISPFCPTGADGLQDNDLHRIPKPHRPPANEPLANPGQRMNRAGHPLRKDWIAVQTRDGVGHR